MVEPEKVVIYPCDKKTMCGHIRTRWPGEALAAQGKNVVIRDEMPLIGLDADNNVVGADVEDAEVVVLQRPASYQYPQIIKVLQASGVRVVIDMDDSMSKMRQNNGAFKMYDPRSNHRFNWMHVARSCELADLVVVTTAALAEEYGSHGRVEIIDNHIPRWYFDIPRQERELVNVGWAGWTTFHPGDLNITRGMVYKAVQEAGASFVGFGDKGIFAAMGMRLHHPHQHWDFVDMDKYPARLAGLDIGIVPLAKNPFNDAKSWLKMLEYASVGVVPVGSDSPDNLRLHEEYGIGFIARNRDEWYEIVKDLCLDHDKRAELSKQNRELASKLILEDNTHLWWDAWSRRKH